MNNHGESGAYCIKVRSLPKRDVADGAGPATARCCAAFSPMHPRLHICLRALRLLLFHRSSSLLIFCLCMIRRVLICT
jgi:hypothetical protein